MPIAVFGSINIDLVTYSKHLPRPGETLHGTHYRIGLGGKGCNQAAAVTRLGERAKLVGRIGKDAFGETALAFLKEHDVSLDGIFIDETSDTGMAAIGVDERAENCITVIGGANMAIDGSDVVRASSIFDAANILLLQMEIPLEAGLAAGDIVRAHGGRVILDPAPAPQGGYSSSVYSRIDIITPNETETEILTGLRPGDAAQAKKAALILRQKGVAAAVIKLGADGVYFQDVNEEGFVPPFKVESVDSVAAGDCFNGGLAYALACGHPLAGAVRFAAACGALSTTKPGAADSAPTLAEIKTLLAE